MKQGCPSGQKDCASVAYRIDIRNSMRQITGLLQFAFAATALYLAAGCQLDKPDARTNAAGSVSGDVSTEAALARVETDRGYELLKVGNFSDAEKHFNRAILADPAYGPAHNDLGMIYYDRGELYNAAWQFQNASKLMPGQAPPQNNLGLVLEDSGKLAEAQAAEERACELDPENAEYAGNLARVRLRQGLHDETTNRLLELVVARDLRPEWVNWAQFNLIRNRSAARSSLPATYAAP
jgi:Flp pilus assembly protein TadD